MIKSTTTLILLICLTYSLQAHNTNIANHTNTIQVPIEIRSVKNIVGDFHPMEHTKVQVRLGYITLIQSDGKV